MKWSKRRTEPRPVLQFGGAKGGENEKQDQDVQAAKFYHGLG